MELPLLRLYKTTLRLGTRLVENALEKRLEQGKEDPNRINERKGISGIERPDGCLIWFHVASVGEAQSVLLLIDEILKVNPAHNILVTSITKTSAELLQKFLPPRAFHQYAPFDHPDWVKKFLDHWQPNFVFWVESELWPCMLTQIHKRHIPAILINARLSKKSLARWRFAKSFIEKILNTFDLILCQTEFDKVAFESLGAARVVTSGNIKYSAKPLPYNLKEFETFEQSLNARKIWIYASSHEAEEEIAAKAHLQIKQKFPEILTLIAPRHPERAQKIFETLLQYNLKLTKRSDGKIPNSETDIFVIDSLGELGLFYKLCDIAMIGRSLSLDGGGGHNPLEALRHDAVILHGKNIQNLQDIFDDLKIHHLSIEVKNSDELALKIIELFENPQSLETLKIKNKKYIEEKNHILDIVFDECEPFFLQNCITPPRSHIVKETP